MGNLKEEIIKSIKEAREIANRLGFKNFKTALESSANSFIGTKIDSNARFFERTEIDFSTSTISQNGKTYSIALTDGNLPNETIEFFFNSLIGYYNYKALVDNTKSFYATYESAIEKDPTIDVVTLVGDAIAMEGDNASSIKLDLLYLKNNSLGTLNQRTVGFENALFHIFGAYHEDDVQIQNFINAICSRVDENQRDLMKQNIIDCFSRANERFGACENINTACRILIEKFSGVTLENYHEKMRELYDEEKKKYPAINTNKALVDGYISSINANNSQIEIYKKLLTSLRQPTDVEAEINSYKKERNDIIRDLQRLDREERDTKKNLTYSDEEKKAILDNIEIDRKNREKRLTEINHTIIPSLELEHDILTNDTSKVTNIPPYLDDKGELHLSQVITVDGVTREVANPEKVEELISKLEAENDKLTIEIARKDAELIAAHSLILYSLNFQRLGGEVVEAINLLQQIGYNPSDLDFNSEQIKQALSIANNLTILGNQDFFDGDKELLNNQNFHKNILFEIQDKYTQPSKDSKGRLVLPEGKFDVNLLTSEIIKLCSNENNPDGSKNIFFGRQNEIFEQLGIAVNDVANTKKINNTNYVALRLKMLDPKTKDFNYRTKLNEYYKKQGLIPVKQIKIGKIQYILGEEYKPHDVFRTGDNPPPPPPPEEPKKIDYCREMRNALNREIDALNGAINKGNLENSAETEFNKKYVETLQKVVASFDYYIGKPEAFEKYQQRLLGKLQRGEKLSEKDSLMLRFCPLTNPMLMAYKEKIDAANASGKKEEIESLLVGGTHGRGSLIHGNSIFPHPLNEGLKAGILTVYNESYRDGKVFDVSLHSIEDLEKLKSVLGDVQESFKSIIESEDYAKYKDFLTLEIVDGKLTITNDLYIGKDGKTYTGNPYDKTSMEYKSPANPQLDKLLPTSQFYIIGASGDLELVDLETFKSNADLSSQNLVEVSSGKYVAESQIQQINDLAIIAMQTNPKINAPKVQILPISVIENTASHTSASTVESSDSDEHDAT